MRIQIEFKFYMSLIAFVLLLLLTKGRAATKNNLIPFNEGLWGGNVQAIAINPDDQQRIYIGTLGGGFYYTIDGGESWSQQNTGLGCWTILSLMVKKDYDEETVLYAGTKKGLYKINIDLQDLNQMSWEPGPSYLMDKAIYHLRQPVSYEESTFVYIIQGDMRHTFTELCSLRIGISSRCDPVDFNYPDLSHIYDLLPTDDPHKFHVGTDVGYFRFWQSGVENDFELKYRKVCTLARRPFEDNYLIYAGTENGGRFSTKNGKNWSDSNAFMPGKHITIFAPQNHHENKSVFVGTVNSQIWQCNIHKPDSCKACRNEELPELPIQALVVNDDWQLFAGTSQGIHFSNSEANSWQSRNTEGLTALRIHDLVFDSDDMQSRLWAATDGAIFFIDSPPFHAAEKLLNWSQDNFIAAYVTCLAMHPDNSLFAGTKEKGLFRKKEYNTSPINRLRGYTITAITIDEANPVNLYVGTEKNGLFKLRYVDGTIEIQTVNSSIKHIKNILIASTADKKIIYIVISDNQVFELDDSQFDSTPISSWTPSYLEIFSLIYNQATEEIFASTSKGVYVHSIHGETKEWNQYPVDVLQGKTIKKIQIIPTVRPFKGILYAMMVDSIEQHTMVYRTLVGNDSLADMTPILEEMFSEKPPLKKSGKSFCVNQVHPNSIYVGTDGTGAYRYHFEKEIPAPEVSSINFGTIPLDSSVVWREFKIKNNNRFMPLMIIQTGNAPIELELSPQDTILFPGDEVRFAIRFSPETTGCLDSVIILNCRDIFENHEIDTVYTIRVSGTGESRPCFNYVSTISPELAKPVNLEAIITNDQSGINPDSVQLRIRKGGEHTFTSVNFSKYDKGSGKFIFIITGDMMTSQGIEYYLRAQNNSGISGYYPENTQFGYLSPTIRIPAGYIWPKDSNGNLIHLKYGDTESAYQLISFPMSIDRGFRDMKQLLEYCLGKSDGNETNWRCADYYYFADNDTSHYIYHNHEDFPEYEPGKAFFLIIHPDLKEKYLKSPAGYTNRTDQIFEYHINKGWNLVANPFDFPMPLDNLSLSKSELIQSIHEYQNGWKDIKNTRSIESVLSPWTGYALWVKDEEILRMNPNFRRFCPLDKHQKTTGTTLYQWFISIEAYCRQACNCENIAAVSEHAQPGYDRLDQPEPPPIGDYVMLSFPHSDWKNGFHFFTTDVQPPLTDGNSWDFCVYTNIPNSETRLNFLNLQSVPDKFQIILMDEHLDKYQDLQARSSYIFNSATARSARQFRLLVGTKRFIQSNNIGMDSMSEDYRLFANFPNPIIRVTYIRYDLPICESITIAIYNILGERVKTLTKHHAHPAGRHHVEWDGTNEAGQPVGSGIYFCNMHTSHYSCTKKMIMLK